MISEENIKALKYILVFFKPKKRSLRTDTVVYFLILCQPCNACNAWK